MKNQIVKNIALVVLGAAIVLGGLAFKNRVAEVERSIAECESKGGVILSDDQCYRWVGGVPVEI